LAVVAFYKILVKITFSRFMFMVPLVYKIVSVNHTLTKVQQNNRSQGCIVPQWRKNHVYKLTFFFFVYALDTDGFLSSLPASTKANLSSFESFLLMWACIRKCIHVIYCPFVQNFCCQLDYLFKVYVHGIKMQGLTFESFLLMWACIRKCMHVIYCPFVQNFYCQLRLPFQDLCSWYQNARFNFWHDVINCFIWILTCFTFEISDLKKKHYDIYQFGWSE
jgi:hypothetical protein